MSESDRSEPREAFAQGMIGFYVACTVMGITIAVAAVCLIVFGDKTAAVVVATIAGVLAVVSTVASWYFLRASRGG